MRYSILPFAFLTLCAWLPAQDEPDAAPPTLDRPQATSRLAEARAKLDSLPADAVADSPDALLRQAWERRVGLLEEAIQLLTRSEAQDAAPAKVDARREAHEARVLRLANTPAVEAVEAPTEEGFAKLEASIEAERNLVTSLRTEEADQARLIEQIPTLQVQARARLDSALERQVRLAQEGEAAADPARKELLRVQAGNAGLDADVARYEQRVLDGDRELEKILAPLRSDERDVAEQLLERSEQDYGAYRQALEQEMGRQTSRLERELDRLERALEAAQGSAELFVASKLLETKRFEKDKSEHARILRSLRADLTEQQTRLTVEVDELKSLRDYLEKAGTGEQAGERIKYTMRRVRLRRQALERTLRRDVAAEMSDFRARRFELEDELFFLKDAWQQEVESTARQLTAPAGEAFRETARGLLEPYRTALREGRDLLTELIGVGQEFRVALIERRDALEALESFIRSEVFWIRDARPIGVDLWPGVVAEARVVSAWARDLGAPRTSAAVADSVTSPGTIATLLLLLVGLPVGLFWVRQRLRRFVTRMNDRTVRRDAHIADRLLAVGGGVLSVALLPVFLFIVGRSLDGTGLPETLVPVLRSVLDHLAVFLLFWFLSRSFFAGRGTAQVQFGMDRDAAHNLHRALCVLLVGYLVFFSARSILSNPPFLLESQPLAVLPRLAYTAFLIVAVVAGILLLQSRSAFSRYWAATLGDNFLGRRWPVLGGFFCLLGVGIVVLEIAGYRYSAGVLIEKLALSLAAVLVLVPTYKGLVVVIGSRARSRRAKRPSDGGMDAEPADAEDARAPEGPAAQDDPRASVAMAGAEPQIRKFVRILFIIGGVILIASLWGIDRQVFDALDLQKAYDIRDTGEGDEFVSYLDLLLAVCYVLGTYLLLKHLPGLYESGIFSRLKLDSGLKYAILTISRYGIFTLGAFAILSAFHLDLGRLGWLMAAMGVGLGFGLQEIVSNFVSGIILLVERPVRVGDVVTVGTTSGKVQRINIRATSVINFDRQEIIVPNRSLITKEVTNWTRGDTIIRLVVPIGVAYGSDVDLVTDTLLEIASEQLEILVDPQPQALFLAHGESSLDFELRVFVPDPSVKLRLLHRLNRSINRRLAALGIEIPFPQRDLHIRAGAEPWPVRGSAESTDGRAVKTS